MSEPDLATLVAQEIAKQVPIKPAYDDAASPAMKQVGALLEDILKTSRLALFPFQLGATWQERFRRFIERSAGRVEQDKRELPAPQILGPILEGIRYEPEGSITDDAFSRLLSAAMDRERTAYAHPAFPSIIRALSDDEILLVRRLLGGEIRVPYGYQSGAEYHSEPDETYAQVFPEMAHPNKVLAYAEHLYSRAIITPLVGQHYRTPTDGPFAGMNGQCIPLRLSTFGHMFAQAIAEGP